MDVVPLEVCVRDRNGRYLSRLEAEDFVVLEERVPQRIQFFEASGDVPLAVTLLVDSSSSMSARGMIERAKAAVRAFLGGLRAGDLVEVITFNERADRRYALGPDHEAAASSIANVSARGRTGLYAAVAVALRSLERALAERQLDHRGVVVILSDGQDTSRLPRFEDVLEDVRRTGILVYVASLRTDKRGRWLAPTFQLARLAAESGGRAIAVRDPADLTAVSTEIGTELRHLYRLAYVPDSATGSDGGWRSIAVEVRGGDAAEVRTRAGYYAPGVGRQ